jgi:hypothetical protein
MIGYPIARCGTLLGEPPLFGWHNAHMPAARPEQKRFEFAQADLPIRAIAVKPHCRSAISSRGLVF